MRKLSPEGWGLTPLALVLLAFVVFWLQLLGHEAAHDLARDLFAGSADLTGRWPRRVQVAYFAGGPLFTLFLLAAAALGARSQHRWLQPVAMALALSTASRFAFIIPGTVLGLASDERALSRLLHLPLTLLGLGELGFVAAALWVACGAVPQPARRPMIGWLLVGIAAGLSLALTFGDVLGVPVSLPGQD